jgi:hypothetical protein
MMMRTGVLRPWSRSREVITDKAEVIEAFPNGALVQAPASRPLPRGIELEFRCAGTTGRFVVADTWKHIDGRSAFYSVVPSGADCECRVAHPWFEGARWTISLPALAPLD